MQSIYLGLPTSESAVLDYSAVRFVMIPHLCNRGNFVFKLIVMCLFTVFADSQHQLLGCPSDTCDKKPWLDGGCEMCNCCPKCWSCAELWSSSYECPSRVGLSTEVVSIDLGDFHVSEPVEWSSPVLTKGGWSQCPSNAALLGTGLTFNDAGQLKGLVSWPENVGGVARETIRFRAINTAAWGNSTVTVLDLTFTIVRKSEAPLADKVAEAAKVAAVRAHADAAYGAYTRWAPKEVLEHLANLRSALDAAPLVGGGHPWVWLGALHMNAHKLLEDVLLECELYLGATLGFPDDAVRRDAEANLVGCFEKRKLEAARELWLRGLRRLAQGEARVVANVVVGAESPEGSTAVTSEGLLGPLGALADLRTAAGLKGGFGWGVNQGEIKAALGSALLLAAELDPGSAAALVAEAKAVLTEAETLNHPWTLELLDFLKQDQEMRTPLPYSKILEWASSMFANFKRRSPPAFPDEIKWPGA